LSEIPCGSAATNEINNCHKKGFLSQLSYWSDIPVPRHLSQWAKSNQDHVLTTAVQELSGKNTNTRRRVGSNPLLVHLNNSMCENRHKSMSISPESQWQELFVPFIRRISHRLTFASRDTQKSKSKME
jgi:hypothetical protein